MNIAASKSLSTWKRIWVGPDGLRAGWSVLLFLVIASVAMAIIGTITHLLHLPHDSHHELTPLGTIALEAVPFCGVLIATWVMARIEKRSWLSYGLRAPHRAFHFGQGVIWGLVMLAAVLGVLYLSGAAVIGFSGTAPAALFRSGVLWAIAFLLVGATEELAFRGYAFSRLARGTNPLIAAIIMSLLFGCAHLGNGGEGIVGIALVVAFGLMACLAVWRTGSLWWVIGLHAAWDWSESYLFGTADSGLASTGRLLTTHAIGPTWLSGGSVGPEGSMIVFPALAVLALAALFILPRRNRSALAPIGE